MNPPPPVTRTFAPPGMDTVWRVITIGEDPRASGSVVLSPGQADERRKLRAIFDRDHAVRLRGFLSDATLERVHDCIEAGEFTVREHAGISTELCIESGAAPALLLFLTNDVELFGLVRAITGCGRIGLFDGRVYRMLAGSEHEDSWHDDLGANRMVAMSVNLGYEPYEGGVLEIRDRDSREILSRLEDPGPGDATLFRIDPKLQHRVSSVEGETPRTAFAGWFASGPDNPLLSVSSR
jgi:2-oxoglutarate-Fe(II)-dependent oxygenase superfamily protein